MPNYDDKTLGMLFDQAVERHGRRPFLIYEGERYTYREAQLRVDAIARGLLRCGFKRGDHIALWMSNSAAWVFIQQAVLKIGGVLIALNTHAVSREMFYMLRQSDAVGLIFERQVFKHDFIAMLQEMSGGVLDSERIEELFPLMRIMVGMGDDLPDFVMDMGELLRRGASVPAAELAEAAVDVRCDDMAMMLYTSGTTGTPKGALLRHGAVAERCRVFAEWFGLTEADVGFYAQPLYHVAGCLAAVENAIVTGGCVCCLKRFNAARSLEAIERYRCTMFYCVPTILAELVHHPDFERRDLSSMRTGIVSGAPVAPALVREAMWRFIPQLISAYGCTESCTIATATRLGDAPETVSTRAGVPMPHCDVRILGLDDGSELPAGAEGEICIRSDYNMACYYNKERETRAAIDERGFLHTGDIGCFDSAGYLMLTGRKSDMIIVGGVNVHPAEIESALDAFPGIRQSQVVSVADAKLGEVPFAFVIPEPGCVTPSSEELYRYCRGVLSSYKVPKYVKAVDSFPLTGTDKPIKGELRKHAHVTDDCLRLF